MVIDPTRSVYPPGNGEDRGAAAVVAGDGGVYARPGVAPAGLEVLVIARRRTRGPRALLR
jgi:hypothetical protein